MHYAKRGSEGPSFHEARGPVHISTVRITGEQLHVASQRLDVWSTPDHGIFGRIPSAKTKERLCCLPSYPYQEETSWKSNIRVSVRMLGKSTGLFWNIWGEIHFNIRPNHYNSVMKALRKKILIKEWKMNNYLSCQVGARHFSGGSISALEKLSHHAKPAQNTSGCLAALISANYMQETHTHTRLTAGVPCPEATTPSSWDSEFPCSLIVIVPVSPLQLLHDKTLPLPVCLTPLASLAQCSWNFLERSSTPQWSAPILVSVSTSSWNCSWISNITYALVPAVCKWKLFPIRSQLAGTLQLMELWSKRRIQTVTYGVLDIQYQDSYTNRLMISPTSFKLRLDIESGNGWVHSKGQYVSS